MHSPGVSTFCSDPERMADAPDAAVPATEDTVKDRQSFQMEPHGHIRREKLQLA